MNVKVKTTFIIIITLVIGIVIGAMLNRALLQQRIKRTISMANPNRLVAIYEEIILPDSVQTKMIREILSKHAKQVSEIRMKARKDMQSTFESTKKELDKLLTPEQKKRLEKRLPNPLRRIGRFPMRRNLLRNPRMKKPPRY